MHLISQRMRKDKLVRLWSPNLFCCYCHVFNHWEKAFFIASEASKQAMRKTKRRTKLDHVEVHDVGKGLLAQTLPDEMCLITRMIHLGAPNKRGGETTRTYLT